MDLKILSKPSIEVGMHAVDKKCSYWKSMIPILK
jgi:hypothetical protein